VHSLALSFEGDLKTFLLSRRQMVGQNMKEAEDISPAGLTQMALDVAYGLQYLSELKYVHRYVVSMSDTRSWLKRWAEIRQTWVWFLLSAIWAISLPFMWSYPSFWSRMCKSVNYHFIYMVVDVKVLSCICGISSHLHQPLTWYCSGGLFSYRIRIASMKVTC